MLLPFLSGSPLPVWYLARLAFAGRQSVWSVPLSHGNTTFGNGFYLTLQRFPVLQMPESLQPKRGRPCDKPVADIPFWRWGCFL